MTSDMKKEFIAALILLSIVAAFAQRPETLDRVNQSLNQKIPATFPDVLYGDHAQMKLDFWKANGRQPAPVFVWIHGGGFRGGDKNSVNPQLLEAFLKNGVSVVSINYRLSDAGPYPLQMNDSAHAIQFIRSKAGEWNINPERIAAGGDSAGSGISQWLAFHDDLANPESNDPLERLSTRLCCVLALNMQSTYDPRVIKKIIPGDAFNNGPLKSFFGLPDNWNWETEKINVSLDALIKDASPINHLTADDAPAFIFHFEKAREDGNVHHPNFGNYLEDAMNSLGIECIRRTSADYNTPDAKYDEMVQFALRYLNK